MMSVKIFPILIICVTAISLTKSENSIAALKKLLHKITASENSYNDHYSPYHHGHKRGKADHIRHHEQDSTNLMNVQTMNLYIKPNKRQREEAEVKELIRTEDRMCKTTGRCGCSGARCGNKLEDDKIAKEVDWLVDEVNYKLPRDDEQQNNNNNREQDDKDEEKNTRNEIFDIDDEKIYERDVAEENKDDELHYLHDRQGEKDDDSLDFEKLNMGDDIDVVVLDKSDLERFLRNEDFIDLTRNDQKRNQNQEIYEKVLEEYKKLIAAYEKSRAFRTTTTAITPDDFFNEYDALKQRVLSKALRYIKSKNYITFLKLKNLTVNQKRKLRHLKKKFALGQIRENDLEDAVVQVIFGQDSSSTILPHDKKSNNIYVPKWIYKNLVDIKKTLRIQSGHGINKRQTLKVPKRIMPLTLQQKGRMTNKKGKNIPKLVWRRNQDFQKYGIPFDFEVTGLGQIAP